MRQQTFSLVKVYGVFTWSDVESSTGASATLPFNQSIWSFLLTGWSNLRQACGDSYEQFRIQKTIVGTSEVQIFIRRNSGRFALCYREAFRR